jgi:hypothetical protein
VQIKIPEAISIRGMENLLEIRKGNSKECNIRKECTRNKRLKFFEYRMIFWSEEDLTIIMDKLGGVGAQEGDESQSFKGDRSV